MAEWWLWSLLIFLDNNSTDAVFGYQTDAEEKERKSIRM